MKIKNLLFQPLTLHIGADGGGLHLSARECRDISAAHISEEIRLAARRGLVSLIQKAENDLQPAQMADEAQPEQKKGKAR